MKDGKNKRNKKDKPDPNQPPKRAVIYARYSSSGQREESIEGQLRDCYEFARQKGLNVIGEYIDKAMSGRSDKRPDFQRMLRDSERGLFEVVITWKMDRFARSRYDSAMYKAKLKKNGVQILYAKETIPEGPEGIILESVMEGYAEYYSENLSQNVKRGYYDSALDRKTLGQKVIGYRRGTDGRFEVDPAQAVIVHRIFMEYAAGERAKDIYERLNAEGYRTSRGGLFNKNSIRRIILNEKYIGVYEYEDIRDENGIPAIIDRELFGRAQEMIKINKDAPGRRQHSFLLTGKIKCGICGEDMTGDSGTSKSGQVYAYYTCNGRKYKKGCKKERAPKDWIENLVIAELAALVNNDDFINEVAESAFAYQNRERDRTALNALEARKKENEKAIANIMSAIEQGIITPTTKSRLLELESESANIDRGIAREMIAEPLFTQEQIAFSLSRFQNGDIEDESYRMQLIDTFLNAVFLYDDDKLVLTLNYSGERSKITLSIMEKAVFKGDGVCSSFAPPPASGKLTQVTAKSGAVDGSTLGADVTGYT